MNTINPINRTGIFLVLAALLVIAAGCISDPPQANATYNITAATTTNSLVPETIATPTLNRSVTTMLVPVKSDSTFPVTPDTDATAVDCSISAGDTRTYPLNISQYKGTNLTREEFLEVNRVYMAFLAKELGQEKAEQMINDEYTRGMKLVLLDPSSGNDTLITLTIDPVEVYAAGEIVNITGTTNLPPGRELTLVIFAGNYNRPISPCNDPWHDTVPRTAVVKAGDSSKNTWSYLLNTSGFKSDDYLIYVRETRNEGAFLTNTLFHLY
ncbi:MAG: hypothetical protein WC342_03745 [Methanoregula sp.]|jgi:hypothetical protein